MTRWIKQNKIKFIVLFITMSIVLGLISIVLFPSTISLVYRVPLVVLDIKSCHEPTKFYVDEQVVYDKNSLEGTIEQIQDKKPGKKQDCYYYRGNKSTVVVLEPATPSIVKVGSKKFKEPALLALSSSSGIRQPLEDEPVSIYYVDDYTDFIWAGGQYSNYKKAITVKRGEYDHGVILAHEYLHYVWERDKLKNDKRLVKELESFYQNDLDLQRRMTNYGAEMTKPTEFFSYGCTEWRDSRLTGYILQKCNHYIDRTRLPTWHY